MFMQADVWCVPKVNPPAEVGCWWGHAPPGIAETEGQQGNEQMTVEGK